MSDFSLQITIPESWGRHIRVVVVVIVLAAALGLGDHVYPILSAL
ncbi:hypothetical protein Aph01nite_12940 [Acrocarpospora phusangensis]|uniref:Uncharacterized protein n=1 Tax=Acrocarpospora phusangensis TaxID=1070424 RepID=A0A919UID3_9ACTN|nr:hypothetical protein [Acrocarpospora phusangensis]GIH22984.1 hypothetical protein Aph01nite_12940 [Acrocarpospora phusangensis]